MKEILAALDRPYCIREKIFLFVLMFIVVGIFLLLMDFLYMITGLPMIYLQLIAWVLWFVWQGYFFVNNSKNYVKYHPEKPYKVAYYRDILFGVAFGISQMLRPFYHGMMHGTIQYDWIAWLLLVLLIFVGIGLMISGFSVIGFAAAGFLYEFKKPTGPNSYLLERGIYKLIRHPLFLGGTIASLGCGIIFDFDSKALGIVNICILPIYHLVENHRQTMVLGHQYIDYSSRVGAFLPNIASAKKSVAEALTIKDNDVEISQQKNVKIELNVKS